jgi:hypothetical protein
MHATRAAAEQARDNAKNSIVKARERPPVLIRWIARPDACIECKRIAAGSPYERLPTWPGLGDTKCVCRCAVEGTRAGNVMAMAGSAAASPSGAADATAGAAFEETAAGSIDAPGSEGTIAAETPATAPTPLEEVGALFRASGPMPSLGSLRPRPLERRWAIALGALIFIAAFVAIFSTQH